MSSSITSSAFVFVLLPILYAQYVYCVLCAHVLCAVVDLLIGPVHYSPIRVNYTSSKYPLYNNSILSHQSVSSIKPNKTGIYVNILCECLYTEILSSLLNPHLISTGAFRKSLEYSTPLAVTRIHYLGSPFVLHYYYYYYTNT